MRGGTGLADSNGVVPPRRKFGTLLRSEPNLPTPPIARDDDFSHHHHSVESSAAASPIHYVDGAAPTSAEASPLLLSPYTKSPWILKSSPPLGDRYSQENRPIGSMVREEGHVYSLATSDGDAGLLYTGSDSKNIRVWKNLKEFSGFKSSSGLVKAIVIWGEKVFTGHQDGKIRVWRVGSRNPTQHKRVGSLPTLKDYITASMNPRNYVEVRRHKTVIRIRHYDAVSCLSLNREQGLLYSGSWDRTLKVWRLSDSKCLESIDAHDDAVNAVVSGFDDLVFTGSADGTAKVWRRHLNGKKATTHFQVQLLMKSEFAVTALAVNQSSGVVYGGTSDGLVNFWEREKLLRHGGVLRGHKLAVLCLAAGGRFVFSGSSDKTICVWRRDGEADHTCLSVLSGHTGPVKCLAAREEDLSAEEVEGGRRWIVYSGSLDKSVKVWRVAEKVDFTKRYALVNHAPPISPLERR